MQITVADTLRHTFVRLEAAFPNRNGTGTTLFQTWASVLGGNDRSEHDVLSSVTDIYAALNRLEMQISTSQTLDELLKDTALSTTASFKPLFSFSNLVVNAFDMRPHCTKPSIGNLAMIGLSMKAEFAEPEPTTTDLETLLNLLEEIRSMLSSVELPVDLRVSLLRHLKAMTWWLNHPDMASMQDIFERSGAAIVICRQMQEKATPEAKERGNAIVEKMRSFFVTVANVMKFSLTHVDQLEHAGHMAAQAIDKL